MQTRGQRKEKVGTVLSNKMEKTITVEIERVIQHPKYKKYIRKHTAIKAHDEKSEAKVGDRVEVMETRPLSKTKSWRLVKILERKASEA
jgi:small subunit ribosomal protein S17